MNQRNLSLAWLVSILLLAVFAGFSWLNLVLTPEAGDQELEISGYLVFPIVSALVLLQGASLLVSFFTPAAVGRVISSILIPVMLVHGLFVFLNLEKGLQDAVSGKISEITGVAGLSSQTQFLAFAGDTYMWVGYLLAVSANLAVLFSRMVLKSSPAVARAVQQSPENSEELWDTQN